MRNIAEMYRNRNLQTSSAKRRAQAYSRALRQVIYMGVQRQSWVSSGPISRGSEETE